MNIRTFGWRDLPLLYRYRDQGVFLDSTRVLVHGPALISLGAFLPYLGPRTRIFTYRTSNPSPSSKPIIAQLTFDNGATFARLSFLAPENTIEVTDLSYLSDYMAVQMGSMGAFHILADVDENSPVYHVLRRAGFAIYARQRIWRLDGQAEGEAVDSAWRACRSSDLVSARSLYCNVVPGLVQQVEPFPKKKLSGYVNYQNGDLNAYIEPKYGRNGIWIQPYVHPDAIQFDRQLVDLLHNLPHRGSRPMFICIRSYQSWLESAVESMGALPGPSEAVMVRHLTLTQRVKQTFPIPAINGTHAEPTAPFARIEEPRLMERLDNQNRA